ncbi:MAG: DEAD/DEAH box helicase [Nostocales cyanobacterium]|nr:MAG: DEAD/DEAH box helicase [Nostocales cyanobacterium]
MTDQVQDIRKFSRQKLFKKEDNLLPYEKPKLRKYGKINHATNSTFFIAFVSDGLFDYFDSSFNLGST